MKRDGRFKDLLVIFMTALSETEHVIEGLAAGGALLATDRRGRLKWTSRQAQTLPEESQPTTDDAAGLSLPADVQSCSAGTIGVPKGARPAPLDITPKLAISFIAPVGADEYLFSGGEKRLKDEKQVFKETFALTPCESDVLIWISKGKSNRDIAEILGLSPRTVNKFPEQIYAKLAVENRTAAVAMELLMN
jgi:DNA-binding CsgD family transcriptional regulator